MGSSRPGRLADSHPGDRPVHRGRGGANRAVREVHRRELPDGLAGGAARPLASNLNYVPNQTVPNLVVVQVGAGGTVDLFNYAGSAHVIADVAGWYGS